VDNLFMAGRCISVTHEALGTVRVMRTCGMMGEVVGKAAYVAVKNQTTPRGVYQSHLEELKDLWRQPGLARREKIGAPLVVPAGAKTPETFGPGNYPKPQPKLEGIVVDDSKAKLTGAWTGGHGLKNYYGDGYHYASPNSAAEAAYEFTVPAAGEYELRLAWQPHAGRATNATVTINGTAQTVNMRAAPSREDGFHALRRMKLEPGTTHRVIISTKGADGILHADALWVVSAP
jgi:FAD dependent oxidoreductase